MPVKLDVAALVAAYAAGARARGRRSVGAARSCRSPVRRRRVEPCGCDRGRRWPADGRPSTSSSTPPGRGATSSPSAAGVSAARAAPAAPHGVHRRRPRTKSSSWPLVMDVAGRLLLRARDRRAAAVAGRRAPERRRWTPWPRWRTSPGRWRCWPRRRRSTSVTCAARGPDCARSRPIGSRRSVGTPTCRASVARRPGWRRDQDRAGDGGCRGRDRRRQGWPADLAALGVGPADLSPARFR